MKIIKLEIQEAPDGYVQPEYRVAVMPKLKASVFSKVDTIDYTDTNTVIQDIYDLDILVYGGRKETFYIRKKDKEAFQAMIDQFIFEGKKELLKFIARNVKSMDKNKLLVFLQMLEETIYNPMTHEG